LNSSFSSCKKREKEGKKGEYLKIKELALPPESEPKRAVACRERAPNLELRLNLELIRDFKEQVKNKSFGPNGLSPSESNSRFAGTCNTASSKFVLSLPLPVFLCPPLLFPLGVFRSSYMYVWAMGTQKNSKGFTAIGSTEGTDEIFPVWDVFRRIPQISVSFAPIQMKPSQIFQANSYAISDREKLAKILYIDWTVISDCFCDK
jgi:hypothetical protein